jgi:hypothetical protein
MVHTFPDEFIPLADAFEQAVEASMDCVTSTQIIEAAKTDAQRADGFERYDRATKGIEKLIREALADRELRAFIRTSGGQIEQLINREGWREECFANFGLENVAHHLSSPGVETGGQPVLLRKADFQEWLKLQRHALDPIYTGAPGKPSAIKIVENEHQRRLRMAESLPKVSQEAASLKQWLDKQFLDAPKTTQKTIENRIRGAHRKRALPSGSPASHK